jgi:hypothetical protein
MQPVNESLRNRTNHATNLRAPQRSPRLRVIFSIRYFCATGRFPAPITTPRKQFTSAANRSIIVGAGLAPPGHCVLLNTAARPTLPPAPVSVQKKRLGEIAVTLFSLLRALCVLCG